MRLLLQVLLCFVFVALVSSQGYGRRPPDMKPKKKPTKTVVHRQVQPAHSTGLFDGTFRRFIGGGRLPPSARRVLGSTIEGRLLRPGDLGGILPRHGGVRNEDGMLDGWGQDGSIARPAAVNAWVDPLGGHDFPSDYNGEELVWDQALNRYVKKVAKKSVPAAKTGGIITGGKQLTRVDYPKRESVGAKLDPVGHTIAKTSSIQHNVVKSTGFRNSGLIDPFGNTITHEVKGPIAAGKPKLSSHGPLTVGLGGDLVEHGIKKATGIATHADEIGQAVPIFPGSHTGVTKLGTVNAGHLGVDSPAIVGNNVREVLMGTGATAGHNLANLVSATDGVGFINPSEGPLTVGLGGNPVSHDLAKVASGAASVDQFGNVISHKPKKSANPLKPIPIGPSSVLHGSPFTVNNQGPVSSGHLGIDDPTVVGHSIGGTLMGVDTASGGTHVDFIQPSTGLLGLGGTPVSHDIAKVSSGTSTTDVFGNVISHEPKKKADPLKPIPIGHNSILAGSPMTVNNLGTVNAGHLGVDSPDFVGHNVRASLFGSDAAAGDFVANSVSATHALGFINPSEGPLSVGLGGTPISHDTAKASSGGVHVGLSSLGTGGNFVSGPVHSVKKVGQTGIAMQGHDPLARNLGHNIAKQTIGEASRLIDLGSRGRVSGRDPLALAASHGLAAESLHVAGKTLGVAANGGSRLGVAKPKKKDPRYSSGGGYGRRPDRY